MTGSDLSLVLLAVVREVIATCTSEKSLRSNVDQPLC
jgi:hypothetical protein